MHFRNAAYRDVPSADAFSVWDCVRSADGAKSCGDAIATRDLADGRLALVVVDALGSGERRARTAASLAAHVLALLSLDASPAYALRVADRELRAGGWHDELPPLATLFAAVADAQDGRLRYAAAAHETALILSPYGEHRHLRSSGPVGGLFFDADFPNVDVPFKHGETLVVVTDGIPDSRRDAAFFGTAGTVRSALRALRTGDDPARTLIDDAVRHGGGARRDDGAALVVRRTAAC